MSELKEGMVFKNTREMCEFMGIKYDVDHAPRVYKRLACYCDYHRTEGYTVVVDNVFEDPDFANYSKRTNEHIYNIGDIFDTPSGKIIIIDKIIHGAKNRKAYTCKCMVCGHEYPRYEYNLKKNVGCPVCAGKTVVIGINDMWTTNPEIAKLLLHPEDGYKYTQCSKTKLDWKCPICGEITRNREISNVYNRGLVCQFCSKTQSYPNRFMYNLLKYLGIPFENEIVFDWSRFDNTFRRYDFYLPEYGIIEMMGRQHYVYCNLHTLSGITLQDTINNDIFKKSLALENNITNYLWIDCRISNLKYIKTSILESEFAIKYDLSNVDWDFIDQQSQLNCLEVICDLWKSGTYDKHILCNCLV